MTIGETIMSLIAYAMMIWGCVSVSKEKPPVWLFRALLSCTVLSAALLAAAVLSRVPWVAVPFHAVLLAGTVLFVLFRFKYAGKT